MSNPSAPLDGFLHPSLNGDEELIRKGRIQIRFGVLGGIMAMVYSAFFFAIDHHWGGAIIAICGIGIMQVPWIVRSSGNLNLSGHLYGGCLLLGFTGLSVVGGGLQGHAIAWIAALPLCSLLLMNLRPALAWTGICLAVAVVFVGCDLAGMGFLRTYDPMWETSLRALSHLGLFVFLSFLGLLFEKSRIEAFARFQDANAKLAEANQALVDLNEQKNEFLNIAAHDLKNPLSIICGYADLLRELESPTLEQIRDQSNEILRSGHRMLDIIRNILDVRAIEDGKTKFVRTRCGVQDIIQDLLNDYATAAEDKEISLVYSISTKPPEVWADRGVVHQILDNLVSNAIKFTPIGGTVTIAHSIAGDSVIIEVRDTGPGLSLEDQAQLWGKFARLTPQPTGGESTNGLGLWIMRRLAEEMDGSAFCHSQLGKGSAFGVNLPRWTKQKEMIADPETGPEFDMEPAEFDKLFQDIERRHGGRRRTDPADVALPG